MAKTGSFKELVQTRAKNDKKFAEALLREGIDAMLSGDVETGKTILRDYIRATVGFEKLGEATGPSPRALSACSVRAVIRRPRTSLAFLVIFRSARAWNFTLHSNRKIRPGCRCRSSGLRARANSTSRRPPAPVLPVAVHHR